jgi:drug/metabolite transporter (DMT)-like permease
MNFIIKRLQEPSTYAGIAAFLAGFGLLGLTEHDWNQILGAVAALAGVIAIFVAEKPGSGSNAAQ